MFFSLAKFRQNKPLAGLEQEEKMILRTEISQKTPFPPATEKLPHLNLI